MNNDTANQAGTGYARRMEVKALFNSEQTEVRVLTEYLASHGLDMTQLPVPIYDALAILGIKVERKPKSIMGEHVAKMEISSERIAISLSGDVSYHNRERSILAHLLGHYCLHDGEEFYETRKTVDFDSSYWYVDESMANNFAQNFLMPAKAFVDASTRIRAHLANKDGIDKDEEYLRQMMKIFGAPESCIKRRIADLQSIGLIPSLVGAHRGWDIMMTWSNSQFSWSLRKDDKEVSNPTFRATSRDAVLNAAMKAIDVIETTDAISDKIQYRGWNVEITFNPEYGSHPFEWHISKGGQKHNDPTSWQNYDSALTAAKEAIDSIEARLAANLHRKQFKF